MRAKTTQAESLEKKTKGKGKGKGKGKSNSTKAKKTIIDAQQINLESRHGEFLNTIAERCQNNPEKD